MTAEDAARQSQREIYYQELLKRAHTLNNEVLAEEYIANLFFLFIVKNIIKHWVWQHIRYYANKHRFFCCGKQATTDSHNAPNICDELGRFKKSSFNTSWNYVIYFE